MSDRTARHDTGQETTGAGGEEVDERYRSPGLQTDPEPPGTVRRHRIGLVVGLAAAVLVYLLLPGSLASEARLTAAVAVLMGIWWMTEAIPIPATALLPLVLFPVLAEPSVSDVGASYGDDIIFLFMGGFLLALAMQRWNLHRRIALVTIRAMGTNPTMLIAGFMVATGFLSMWVSNTATSVMMLPIGVSVLLLVLDPATTAAAGGDDTVSDDEDARRTVVRSTFGTALMLGIAYAASIGSLATIIGTPPNTLLVGYLETQGIQIGFGQWMLVGLPLAVVFLVIAWFVLTRVLFKPEIDRIPGGRELIDGELRKLGPPSSGEKRVLAAFVLAALSWVTIPLIWEDPAISDAGIAMTVGVLLFLAPAGAARGVRLLDWDSALKLPWGVLLLFGGGLALSEQFDSSGLSQWIGEQAAALGFVPTVLFVLLLVAGVLLLTELTSNTATAATFLPLVGGVAMGVGTPVLLLTAPVALAATCAFMLPVATPPNAIAYGSGYVTIGQMIRGGIWLNLVAIVLITLTAMTLLVWVFGITY
ncbi:SLC13 family permease [Actinomycetospora cinnamomea]|uniref:Sodium-dependent dicarboxylate transporter SdcS n=1 Tax=Actinomycetospora cinnamomea TaxID=663609 RepID=A0A2U1E8B2_9PSEU|nr:DASS family sodium-coupled anion symporter [Actinomycetospora cinnamomea]PVY96187.1 sodium-dependent dicarboxylate transporter 2/3/5 [Actinomycetospora cinnamomea]